MDEELIEKKIDGETIFKGRLLDVRRDTVKLPDGREATREWIAHPGASAVIPILPDGSIILVRQYRYPVMSVTLEVPAGKLDIPGEDPIDCARRELKEETGWTAEKFTKLTSIWTTVGFTNEVIHIYAAENLKPGKQCTDDDEFINVIKMPFDDAVQKVIAGEITDAKTIAAILILKLRKAV